MMVRILIIVSLIFRTKERKKNSKKFSGYLIHTYMYIEPKFSINSYTEVTEYFLFFTVSSFAIYMPESNRTLQREVKRKERKMETTGKREKLDKNEINRIEGNQMRGTSNQNK